MEVEHGAAVPVREGARKGRRVMASIMAMLNG
jgi:hypothetical protein